jgi:hypothetical protein
MSDPVPRWPDFSSTMFMKRPHQRLRRPVGLPPIYCRASATRPDPEEPANVVGPVERMLAAPPPIDACALAKFGLTKSVPGMTVASPASISPEACRAW